MEKEKAKQEYYTCTEADYSDYSERVIADVNVNENFDIKEWANVTEYKLPEYVTVQTVDSKYTPTMTYTDSKALEYLKTIAKSVMVTSISTDTDTRFSSYAAYKLDCNSSYYTLTKDEYTYLVEWLEKEK